jgi:hypothetical protein
MALYKPLLHKPGKSGSLRSFIGAIANNRTAVPEGLLNTRFLKNLIVEYLCSIQYFELRLHSI